MSPRFLFFIALSLGFIPFLPGQEIKPVMDRSSAVFQLKPSAGQTLVPAASHMPDPAAPQWDFSMSHIKGIHHPGSAEEEAIKALKAEKLIQKRKDPGPTGDAPDGPLTADPPVLFRNFQGNTFEGWYPPDNSIAISDNGYIVSLINSSINVYTQNGDKLLGQSLGDFYSFLGLSNFFYDPRVIYDPDQNKFIMVVLHGNTPAESKIVVSFSETQDPTQTWWSYVFDGNFLNNNTWFDFPSIGVSGEDLFISGNLFNSNDVFSQAAILQIDKQPGFSGGNVNWEYFENVTNGFGSTSFTVAPVSYGFDGSYGPGIYLVSTSSGGGSFSHLYDITGDLEDEQDIVAYEINADFYSPPADGEQLLTPKLLDIGDCRVLDAFYADQTIHYVHSEDYSGGYGGIRYNRMDVVGQSITHVVFGQGFNDFGYPALVPIGETDTDKDVLIAYLKASKSSFPEFRAVSINEAMEISPNISLKEGEYFINVTADNIQRWGDYTGACRKHNAPNPIVWVSGCYGRLNSAYGNWIAEISLDPNAAVKESPQIEEAVVFPNPVRDLFTLEVELREKTYLHIFLSDANGRVVQNLFQGRAKSGINRLSFNKGALNPGMYFLFIRNAHQQTLRQEKIVVAE